MGRLVDPLSLAVHLTLRYTDGLAAVVQHTGIPVPRLVAFVTGDCDPSLEEAAHIYGVLTEAVRPSYSNRFIRALGKRLRHTLRAQRARTSCRFANGEGRSQTTPDAGHHSHHS